MKQSSRILLAAAMLALVGLWWIGRSLVTPASENGLPVVTVFKSPTCGCCTKWIDHLEASGFPVEVETVQDVTPTRLSAGVPRDLSSCHTAIVNGYAVEGHVPAEDIKRMLRDRPNIAGIAVAGMPMGSPGMEGPDPVRYDVFAFVKTGARYMFSRH